MSEYLLRCSTEHLVKLHRRRHAVIVSFDNMAALRELTPTEQSCRRQAIERWCELAQAVSARVVCETAIRLAQARARATR